MRNLLTDPLWKPEDLGKPIPDSPYAVSVCLPCWADNVGYEEGEPRVVDRMQSGYPRFFFHPLCRELFAECRWRFARPGEAVLAFPSPGCAELFQQFLQHQTGVSSRREALNWRNVHAVLFPETVASAAKLGWQHLGLGVTSREAEACVQQCDIADASAAKQTLRNSLAELSGAAADDVYLFPCGMNALYCAHRVLQRVFPGRRSVQFGFPYVDTLKILEKVGPGVHFLPRGDDDDLQRLRDLVGSEPVAGLYTEFPSNPLLVSPPLDALRELSQRGRFPLIVDDTISGFYNVDVLPAADVLTSSLTKFFSGSGDVTGGSAILNRDGPFYAELKDAFEHTYDDTLFPDDVRVLEGNSRDYAKRMPRINESCAAVVECLREHPAVETVCSPQLASTACYERYRKPQGGYSGLFSIVLKEPEKTTIPFFDRLRISKGPNLGTNFSLCCPFTILAHYNELDFAESCGVSRWLIRVSVGLEAADDLIDRFRIALHEVNRL